MTPLAVLAWAGMATIALPVLASAFLAAVICWCAARQHIAGTRAKVRETELVAAFRTELDEMDEGVR